MAEPTNLPIWATDGASLVETPGTAKQQQGWAVEAPNVKFMNWWMNLVYQWILHFQIEVAAVSAQQNNYDAIVGVGGTHADINAALADVGAGGKILVSTPLALTATQVIDQDDVTIEIKPNALISTVTGLSLGIQVTSERVRIIGGRFRGFNGGTDKAIEFSATSKNCLLTQGMFSDNDTDVDDLGDNNTLTANISEVA